MLAYYFLLRLVYYFSYSGWCISSCSGYHTTSPAQVTVRALLRLQYTNKYSKCSLGCVRLVVSAVLYKKYFRLLLSTSTHRVVSHNDKKENQIFLICKEIRNGAVAKSYMTNGLLIYGKYLRISSHIRKPFLIYDFATAPL
jgi:hypothetical protein